MDAVNSQSAELARDLRQSRDEILRAWRDSVQDDPELRTASAISSAQFTDNIPKVLDAFELSLLSDDAHRETQATLEQREGASEHGLQRWQQGYDLRETMREWAHLHRCILAYLEDYAERHAAIEPQVMRRARAALVRLCGDGACESAARYALLQQAEAAGRMRDLEAIVRELKSLERQRIEMLREAAHDLRGSVGVITSASAVLSRSTSDEMRQGFYRILDRATHSARSLLSDLIDLTRLEAGQDRVRVESFDASEMLRDLGESLRAEATQRGLFLKLEGPATLPIRGDRTKIQRIVQNLTLNAFKATSQGGITLAWERSGSEPRWTLVVADTGPGLQGSHSTALTSAMVEATEQSHHDTDEEAAEPPTAHDPMQRRGPALQKPVEIGEGIGLSIVKRLCELLGVAIELESVANAGTTFRLRIPMELATPAPQPDSRPNTPPVAEI